MGQNTANVSRDMFDESKRYITTVAQKGVPVVDADINDGNMITLSVLRRAIQALIGDATVNDGFKCVGSGLSNNFTIKGGDGSADGAGRIWVSGFPCMLLSDVQYVNDGSSDGGASIHPRITGVSGFVLTDSAANYATNALVGRTITPDISNPSFSSVVVSNTANTITLSDDIEDEGILSGSRYRVELSTPGAPRVDSVFLNVYIDEIDSTEDQTLVHSFGAGLEAFLRKQVSQTIYVEQGTSTFADYVDADGNKHYVLKIAEISRSTGEPLISAMMVTDLRATAGSLTSFVRKIGDTMTGGLTVDGDDIDITNGGNLSVDGDISVGGTVDGRDIAVDGAKLDLVPSTGQEVADMVKKFAVGKKSARTYNATGASSINVSSSFVNLEPNGDANTKGVLVSPGSSQYDNSCFVIDSDTGEVARVGNIPVFGRLTYTNVSFSTGATVTFSPGFTSVTSSVVGTFSTLQVGDIIRSVGDPSSVFGVIQTIDPTNQFITLESPYAGTDGTGQNGITARRYTLSFVENPSDSSPNPVTISLTLNGLNFFYREVMDLENRSFQDAMWEAMLLYMGDLSGTAIPTGSAGGDLSGTYPNPSVAQIHGRSVQNQSPGPGDLLAGDGSGGWEVVSQPTPIYYFGTVSGAPTPYSGGGDGSIRVAFNNGVVSSGGGTITHNVSTGVFEVSDAGRYLVTVGFQPSGLPGSALVGIQSPSASIPVAIAPSDMVASASWSNTSQNCHVSAILDLAASGDFNIVSNDPPDIDSRTHITIHRIPELAQ